MEQMSALRAESDRLVERMRASEATVGDLEKELASAQEQVTTKRGEADRWAACWHNSDWAARICLATSALLASQCTHCF